MGGGFILKMPQNKDKWNVTFRKPNGEWSKPMVYLNFGNAERRMYWDERMGIRMTGTYEVEIRRGTTRKGLIIRQFKPYKGYNPHRRGI